MSDVSEAISEAVEKGRESKINSIVAIAVAVTATFTALCNVKDGNIVQGMQQEQASAVDSWSYYQAKSTKQAIAQSALDQLRLQQELASTGTRAPSAAAEAKVLIDKTIKEYEARITHYETEKAEIQKTAQGHQQEYDRLNFHDDQFDMAEALTSIAIALFGITALTQKRALLATAMVFAGLGVLLGVAGFAGLRIHPNFLASLLT